MGTGAQRAAHREPRGHRRPSISSSATGLTAITGETGAGKTMLVEALELVVGGRADPVIVRPGATEARVDARFVSDDDGHEVVLSRVIPAEGRSRAYIDGRPATAAALADVAIELVDLHGQHAHQRLLSAVSQRAALDAFGGVDLTRLRAARARVAELDAELATLGGDDRARARELDLARFQLAELDAAAVDDPDEETSLEVLEDTLASAVEHRTAGALAYETLTGDGGARDAVAAAAAALAGRAPYRALADRLADVLAELDDVGSAVRDTAEQIADDPERLERRPRPPAAAPRLAPQVRRHARRRAALPSRGCRTSRHAGAIRRAGGDDRCRTPRRHRRGRCRGCRRARRPASKRRRVSGQR